MHDVSSHTDIQTTHIVYRLTPQAFWPYLSLMRLDRPIGTWLLLLPAWWALAMEIEGFSNVTFVHITYFFLFGIGAIIMRGAGCVINDLWDRDIDKAVERTRMRPLASGQISIQKAIFFLCGLMSLGLIILLQLPMMAVILGVISLVPVILYPLAKRVTWYPQAVLGLTFNFGALIGSAAVKEDVSFEAMLLYVAGFFWTLAYDTIYAHQDIADDGVVGIKSTAQKFGTYSYQFISLFYAVFIGLIYWTGLITQASLFFYLLWALSCFFILRQINTLDVNNPANCLQSFRANRNIGLIVFFAYFGGYISLI